MAKSSIYQALFIHLTAGMSAESNYNDWAKFKGGDWFAYTAIYNKYYAVLNNYGSKFTKDNSLVQDAVHDLFVRLWTTRERLGDPVSVKNYLFKSLRHILIRKIETSGRVTDIDHDNIPSRFFVSFNEDAFDTLEEKDLLAKLKSYIDSLPARQQEIIYLRFYEGLSYEELAEVMNISIGSTYKLLYKALASLQKTVGNASLLTILYCMKPTLKNFSAWKG